MYVNNQIMTIVEEVPDFTVGKETMSFSCKNSLETGMHSS